MEPNQQVSFDPMQQEPVTFDPLTGPKIESVDVDSAVLAATAYPEKPMSLDGFLSMTPTDYEQFLKDAVTDRSSAEQQAAVDFASTAMQQPDPVQAQATLTAAQWAIQEAKRQLYADPYAARDEAASQTMTDLDEINAPRYLTEQELLLFKKGYDHQLFMMKLRQEIGKRKEEETFAGKATDFVAGMLALPNLFTASDFESSLYDTLDTITAFNGEDSEISPFIEERVNSLLKDWSNLGFEPNWYAVEGMLAEIGQGDNPLLTAAAFAGVDLITAGTMRPASMAAKAGSRVNPAKAMATNAAIASSPEAAEIALKSGNDIVDVVKGMDYAVTTTPGAHHAETLFAADSIAIGAPLTEAEIATMSQGMVQRQTALFGDVKPTALGSHIDFDPATGKPNITVDFVQANGNYWNTAEAAYDAGLQAGISMDRFRVVKLKDQDSYVLQVKELLANPNEITLDFGDAAKTNPYSGVTGVLSSFADMTYNKAFGADLRLPNTPEAKALLGALNEAGTIQSRVINSLNDETSRLLRGLSRKELANLNHASEWSQTNQKWIVSPSKMKSLTGVEPSEKTWEAYQQLRKLNDVEYFFRDTLKRKALLDQGFSGYYFSNIPGIADSRAFVARELTNDQALVAAVARGELLDVYDSATGKVVNMATMTNKGAFEFLKDARIFDLAEWSAAPKGKGHARILVVRGDTAGIRQTGLPERVTPYNAGGRRVYEAKGKGASRAYATLPISRRARPLLGQEKGKELNLLPIKLLAGSTPSQLAKFTQDFNEIIIKGLQTKARGGTVADQATLDATVQKWFGDGYGFKTSDDLAEWLEENGAMLGNDIDLQAKAVWEGQLPDGMLATLDPANNFGEAGINLFSNRPRRDKPLHTVMGTGVRMVPAVAQMERIIHQTAKTVAYADVRNNALQRWDNTFGSLYHGDTPYERMSNGLKKSLTPDQAKLASIAELSRIKVRQMHGVRSKLGKYMDEKMLDWAATLDDMGFSYLASGMHDLVGVNPARAFRSFASVMMLGLLNPGQFLVQTTTAATVLTAKLLTDPVLALHATKDAFFLLAGVEMYGRGGRGLMGSLGKAANQVALHDHGGNLPTMIRHMHEMNWVDISRTHSLGDMMLSTGLSPVPLMGGASIGIKNALQKSAYYLSLPFMIAERTNRAVAFSLAYRQALKELGLKKAPAELTNQLRQRISYLANGYSFRMTQASQSAVEESLLGSVMFQFQAYTQRYMEAMLSSRNNVFKPRERAALALTPFLFAGTAAYTVGDWNPIEDVRDHLLDVTGAEPDPKLVDTLSRGLYSYMTDTVIGNASNAMFGEPVENTRLDVGKRIGINIPVASTIQAMFFSDRPLEDVVFGPSGSIVSVGSQVAQNTFAAIKWTPLRDTPEFFKSLGTAGVELSRLSTGANNIVQGARQLDNPRLEAVTRSGFVMPGAAKGDVLATILGVGPAAATTDYFKAADLTKSYSEDTSAIAKRARSIYNTAASSDSEFEAYSKAMMYIRSQSGGDLLQERRAIESFMEGLGQNKLLTIFKQASKLDMSNTERRMMRYNLQQSVNNQADTFNAGVR